MIKNFKTLFFWDFISTALVGAVLIYFAIESFYSLTPGADLILEGAFDSTPYDYDFDPGMEEIEELHSFPENPMENLLDEMRSIEEEGILGRSGLTDDFMFEPMEFAGNEDYSNILMNMEVETIDEILGYIESSQCDSSNPFSDIDPY